MIQIYNPGNTDYDKNGDMTLFPSKAVVHAVLNGVWNAELEHPVDADGRWKYIMDGAVVKLPSFNGMQLFRVIKKYKSDSGVEAELYPIFMDAKDDCWLKDVRPTAKNGQDALNLMMAPNKKYTGASNITTVSTAYYEYKNLLEAINGDDGNSFINRWGGEILFDNYKVVINKRVGGDYGVELRYGKNIPEGGISEEVDLTNIATRIYPKAYNGYMMSGNGYVDSPIINKYPVVKARTITFSDVKMREDEQEDDEANGVIICDTQAQLDAALKKRCDEQYSAGMDKPSVTISADIVMLQNTAEYKGYKVLETISLGDTVHCTHDKLGITTDARAVELEYDSIKDKVRSVVLGDFQYNFLDDVSSAADRIGGVIRGDGTVAAERISGIIDGMAAKLKAMKDIAQKQNVRAILFEDLDPASPTFGAMALGTAGFEIADKRTADGRDWAWSTFGTAQGFYATYLIAGMLSSRNWVEDSSGFNMDLDYGTINSKHLKLDASGVLKIYQAIIEGGSFIVNYKDDYGIQTPMFAVNENGIGMGPGGQTLTYYAKDSFMTLANELRILSGKLTGYAANGQKGMEMNRTTLNFYSWNDAGNYVGSVGSIRRKSDGRVGINVWCDYGDLISLGAVTKDDPNTVYPIITIDGNSVEGPPWVKGTVNGNPSFISGLSWSNGAITRVDRTTLTVKYGFITGWTTKSEYY
nr:MAG TPA: tail protein [Caudoviricetes sp.]